MSQAVDREGTFRAKPISWRLREGKESSSVGLNICFQILEYQDPDTQEWQTGWDQYDMEVWGTFWFINRKGEISKPRARKLVESLGWSGNPEDFSVEGIEFDNVLINVEYNTNANTGKTKLEAAWIHPWDHVYVPGAKTADPAISKTLQAKHGADLRAIAGNVKRNEAPKPAAAETAPPQEAPKEDIPF